MRLLLDTHALIWVLQDERERLSQAAQDAIDDPANQKLVSVASAWEAAIKVASGRIEVPENFGAEIEGGGFEVLPIGLAHGLAAGALPLHHKDPFDRMLIAQAQIEDCTIVTKDNRFGDYDVALLRA